MCAGCLSNNITLEDNLNLKSLLYFDTKGDHSFPCFLTCVSSRHASVVFEKRNTNDQTKKNISLLPL